MLFIVNTSGGLTSFEALRRTIERHGKENVAAVFADTKAEDPDLYRFLADQESYFGITITRLQEGRTPWEVMHDERCITLQGFAPCSKILKRQVIDRWVSENYATTEHTSVFGMDWTEPNRMKRLAEKLAPRLVWFPLAECPYVTKVDIEHFLLSQGIAIPWLYTQGFDHNNCSGQCPLAGQAHFARLHRVAPARYARMEKFEAEMGEYLGKPVTILRQTINGESQPLTLTEFRERQEAGETDDGLWGGCGCFVDGQDSSAQSTNIEQ